MIGLYQSKPRPLADRKLLRPPPRHTGNRIVRDRLRSQSILVRTVGQIKQMIARMKRMHSTPSIGLVAVLLLHLGVCPAEAAIDSALDIIAVQVRIGGYPCDRALSAEKDERLSRPHRFVWRLTCRNGTYRVHLHPKMAARVERMD